MGFRLRLEPQSVKGDWCRKSKSNVAYEGWAQCLSEFYEFGLGQNSGILLTGRFLDVWEIRAWVSKKGQRQNRMATAIIMACKLCIHQLGTTQTYRNTTFSNFRVKMRGDGLLAYGQSTPRFTDGAFKQAGIAVNASHGDSVLPLHLSTHHSATDLHVLNFMYAKLPRSISLINIKFKKRNSRLP